MHITCSDSPNGTCSLRALQAVLLALTLAVMLLYLVHATGGKGSGKLVISAFGDGKKFTWM